MACLTLASFFVPPVDPIDPNGKDVTKAYNGEGREFFLSLGSSFEMDGISYVVRRKDGAVFWHRVLGPEVTSYRNEIRWIVVWSLIGGGVYRLIIGASRARLKRVIVWSLVITPLYFALVAEVGWLPLKRVSDIPTTPNRLMPEVWYVGPTPYMLAKINGSHYEFEALDLGSIFVKTVIPYWIFFGVFSCIRIRMLRRTAVQIAAIGSLCLGGCSGHAPPPKLSCNLLEFAAHGLENEMRVCLEKGITANEKDSLGWTPLMVAALTGRTPIIKLLGERGADPAAKALGGVTSLMLASHAGQLDAVQALIENRADVNAETSAGLTALMFSANRGSESVIRMLIANGAKLNERTNRGVTALMFAARAGSSPAVKALLAGGADAKLVAWKGLSAHEMATIAGHAEIKGLLAREIGLADSGSDDGALRNSSGAELVEERLGIPIYPGHRCSDRANPKAEELARRGQLLLAQSISEFENSNSVARPRLTEARRLLEAAIRMEPKLVAAIGALAQISSIRPAEAAAILEQGLQACPDDAILLSNLGAIRQLMGDLNAALAAKLRVLEIGDGDVAFASSYFNLGTAQAALGHHDAARDGARTAVLLDRGHFRAWRNYVLSTYKVGELLRARQLAQTLSSLDPNGKEGGWAKQFLIQAPIVPQP